MAEYGGNTNSADGCRKCGDSSHIARECSLPDVCRKCKEEGHMARDCSLPDTCRQCGKEGHLSADCTEEEVTRAYTNEDGEVREIYVPKKVSDSDLFNDQSTISSGINFAQYANIDVKVTGENIPAEIDSFEACGLRPIVLANVKKNRYTVPTPVQKAALPIIISKRDLLASAQTGSGKTAAFLLPVINNLLEDVAPSNVGAFTISPQCVVMTPTRELAIQICEQARKFSMGSSICCKEAYGGTSCGYQLRDLQRGCNILVATPGRLLDFVNRGNVVFSSVQYFILDEADRMLDMGFGPDINKCMVHPTMPSKEERTTLMFSATFPADVKSNARQYLRRDHITLAVGMVGGACKDVKQRFIQVDKPEKKGRLLEILEDKDPMERILIFVNQKKQADFLMSFISMKAKIPATSIHGDRLQREREQALRDFKRGSHPVLVATAVAARGLDIPNVGHVVNYDMPTDVDEYVHRIGRTGRVGNIGRATSFFDPSTDSGLVGPLSAVLLKSGVDLPPFLADNGYGGRGGGDDDDEW
jgi:probable ATP-dependent RNA helicase DDX4